MAKLGISIYPEHSTIERDKAYIALAAKYGFQSIFSCLLSVEETHIESAKANLRELCDYAHDHGMEVIFDVAPSIFSKFGISYSDLSFFHEIGADGIRLDEGFDGHTEAMMTYNPFGLKLCINASAGTKYLDHICSYHPKRDILTSCHNFYPQRYTGLSFEHFMQCNRDLKALQMPIGAFVSSQEECTFGPWPVYEGLCTLEEHRDLPIDLQVRHLIALDTIDEILVGNAYASEAELKAMAKYNTGKLSFAIELEYELSDTERAIVFEHPHFIRGDVSAYMLRSTMPRIEYAKHAIAPQNTRDLKRGDIVVVNENYGRYKGELHIVLRDMKNKGDKNVVGHLRSHEEILLDYAQPWRSFALFE